MTLITFQGGRVVMRDGQVGTGPECCCGANCGDCPLTCCLVVQGKNTCTVGTDVISFDPLIVINWGGEVLESGSSDVTYQYLSDALDLLIEIIWFCSESGELQMDVSLSESVPGGGAPATSFRRWQNARAILGSDGCPTGVNLGELTESNGPDPQSEMTLSWECT